jgi:exodeoxyribonuclease-3
VIDDFHTYIFALDLAIADPDSSQKQLLSLLEKLSAWGNRYVESSGCFPSGRLEWDRAFLSYLKQLERRKPIIFCGDLNVAHTELDLANPKANVHNHGFTPEERAGFSALVQAGFVDTFREFEAGGGHYTWWSPMAGARARNVGWRLDYFLISAALRPRLKQAFIRAEVPGSDHCPVGMVLK